MHPQQTRLAVLRAALMGVVAAGAITCICCYEVWAANAPPSVQFPAQINPNIRQLPPINRPNQQQPTQATPNQQPANPNQPPANQAPANNANQAGGGIRTATITFTGTGAPLTGGPTGGLGVRVRTPAVTFTGTGGALVTPSAPMATVTVRTSPITFSGTGAM
jgi:hypothetical protein